MSQNQITLDFKPMNINQSASAQTVQDADRARPLSLLICALGGEGGGVLSAWLTDIARHAGYAAQSTSIPGVAQRTGATTYFFELFPVPLEALDGRKPVFSLNPIPGALDAVVSSELLETARCASNGLPSPERTLIISSSSRTLTTSERSHLGDGRLDDSALLAIVQAACRAHHVLDMQRIASEQGTIVSAVMLGAIAGSGLLPFNKQEYVDVIRLSERGVLASIAGFEAAWRVVTEGRMQAEHAQAVVQQASAAALDAGLDEFPLQARTMIALGLARVREYQDAAYGALYLQRLCAVCAAESLAANHTPKQILRQTEQSQSVGDDSEAASTCTEVARWLALWMAFDDIVRVADLKSRASRSDRVRTESRAAKGDVLKVYDHFKPGVPEIAAMLPQALSERLLDMNRQRVAEGRDVWSMPLKLASHTVLGTLLLRLLASMKYVRRFGSRYSAEQVLIEEWLAALTQGLQEDAALGHEIALCGRLIKGYGSTNERGRDNLLHVIRHLAQSSAPAADRAVQIRKAREAALADEAGVALDKTLQSFGAPARVIKAQPIRWMARSRTDGGSV